MMTHVAFILLNQLQGEKRDKKMANAMNTLIAKSNFLDSSLNTQGDIQ